MSSASGHRCKGTEDSGRNKHNGGDNCGKAEELEPRGEQDQGQRPTDEPTGCPRRDKCTENDTGDAADEQGGRDIQPKVAEQKMSERGSGDEWRGLNQIGPTSCEACSRG